MLKNSKIKTSQCIYLHLIILFVFCGIFACNNVVNASVACSFVHKTNEAQQNKGVSWHEWNELAKLKPFGSNKSTDKFQFGFESEYEIKFQIKDLELASKEYAPVGKFNLSTEHWLKMSWPEKQNWLQELLKNKKFQDKSAVLKRISTKAEDQHLPEFFHFDDTGNLELLLPPRDDLIQWRKTVEDINSRFGFGSMQAMISIPRDLFFEKRSNSGHFEQNEGWLKYMGERDVIEKLLRGAARVDQFPDRAAAPSFLHPNLGPLSDYRANRLHKYLRENSNELLLTREDLERVLNASSFKYIGSTTYRPDVAGPDRSAFEVRDAHKDQNLLFERVARTVKALSQDRSRYLGFAKIQSFPINDVFIKLDPKIQSGLKEIFPPKIPSAISVTENSGQAWLTYMNFGYPMRDWTTVLVATHRLDLLANVQLQQSKYLQELTETVSNFKNGTLSATAAGLKIQAHLVKFIKESQLMGAFESWESIWQRDAKKATDLSYEDSAASVLQNVAHLVQENSKSMQLVPEVGFKANAEEEVYYARRPVLVVSTYGMSDLAISSIRQKVLSATSQNTVSFPLKEGGTHLFVRQNDRVYDYGFDSFPPKPSFRTNEDRVPKSDILEPVVALSGSEQTLLRKYIDAAKESWWSTLGFFQYKGGKNPNGEIENNRCSVGGHNCTSWISLSPIGAGDKKLVNLISPKIPEGATIQPVIWSRWILATASKARVPLAIYWTQQPLDKISVESVVSGQKLDWSFSK